MYQLLAGKEMCSYYALSEKAGVTPKSSGDNPKYAYLDDPEISSKIIEFSDGDTARVTFNIPSMHCASCIYLLEQINRIEPAINHSRVNFISRELTLTFRQKEITLRQVVGLLAQLGYEPEIRLESLNRKQFARSRRQLWIRIGVAGFCFGNVMMLSFPEYLTRSGEMVEPGLRMLFGWLNLALAIPATFYSGWLFLSSAVKAIRHKSVNLDVPLSVGIMALFVWSVYEVVSGGGAGYFDSLTGLIFLLLIGRIFQEKTYETLSFERDYTSYFPIAVFKKLHDGEKSVPVTTLVKGDRIIIRNGELIPADAVLMDGDGRIDYSFVTGESEPVERVVGDLIHAGGRQTGGAIELEVVEEVSRSYLTRLWNQESFQADSGANLANFANHISKFFVLGVLLIATVAFFAWISQPTVAIRVFAAVLIVACPCALALAVPFTFGTAQRLMGRAGLYLKNSTVVERMSGIGRIVFDKTGTLTYPIAKGINYAGEPLSDAETGLVRSLARHSQHPISIRIYNSLQKGENVHYNRVNELSGKGIEGDADGYTVRIGSAGWLGGAKEDGHGEDILGLAYVAINSVVKGRFEITGGLRDGLAGVIGNLAPYYGFALLSGDLDREQRQFRQLFPKNTELLFRQSPYDKLEYITGRQKQGEKVLMVGDGLNDAGALKAADVGLAVTEDVTAFSPASDGLLAVSALNKLDKFLRFARVSRKIVIAGFVISLLYNLVGLSFAVTGKLTPLVSAVLMPISSITLVVFSTVVTKLWAKRVGVTQ